MPLTFATLTKYYFVAPFVPGQVQPRENQNDRDYNYDDMLRGKAKMNKVQRFSAKIAKSLNKNVKRDQKMNSKKNQTELKRTTYTRKNITLLLMQPGKYKRKNKKNNYRKEEINKISSD